MPSGYFSATAAATDSGATATQAADASMFYVVKSISGHTDTDSIIQITDAGVVKWESKIDISVQGSSFDFDVCIPIAKNAAAAGVLASSTADGQVNISGEVY